MSTLKRLTPGTLIAFILWYMGFVPRSSHGEIYIRVSRGAFVEKGLSASAMQDHLKLWGAWMGELAKQGHQPAGEAVQQDGRTIRGKKKVVTDGPYAELKDLVTGNLAIEAASLDEAANIALGCPIYIYDGSVEVRAVAQVR
jgi:hypothetical protein